MEKPTRKQIISAFRLKFEAWHEKNKSLLEKMKFNSMKSIAFEGYVGGIEDLLDSEQLFTKEDMIAFGAALSYRVSNPGSNKDVPSIVFEKTEKILEDWSPRAAAQKGDSH